MRNFWAVLINQWRLMGLILLITVLLAGSWIVIQVPLYTASTVLLIEPPPSLSDRIDAEDAQDRYYRRQVDLLRSPALAAEVIKSLNLEAHTGFAEAQRRYVGFGRVGEQIFRRLSLFLTYSSYLLVGTPGSYSGLPSPAPVATNISSDIIDHYLTLLTVTPDLYTYSAEVTFTTSDPTLSQDLANAHAATFVRNSQAVRFEISAEDRPSLTQELSAQEEQLAQSEARLQQFRQEHGDVAPPSKDNLVAQRLLDTHQRLANAKAKRINLAILRRMTEKKEAPQLVTLIKSDRLNQLRAAFNRLEAESTRLATLLSASHPRLGEVTAAKNTARQRLEHELTALVSPLEAEYIAARDAEAVLQEEVKQQRKAAQDRGDLAVVYASLNADVTSAQTLVHTMREQQQDGAILKTMAAPNITVTALAELPLTPSSPQPTRDLLLALLAGTIVALGLAFFFEWTDTSVHTAQDVLQATAYPLLGTIPPQPSRLRTFLQGKKRDDTSSSSKREVPAEGTAASPTTPMEWLSTDDLLAKAYVSLSAALPLRRKSSPHTILFVSPQSGDGKTTTLLQLARTLARDNYKVVVVDADLRTGRCHTLLQRDRSPGLTEVLFDGAALSSSSRRRSRRGSHENHTGTDTSASEPTQEEYTNEPQRIRSSPKLRALVEAAIQATAINGLYLIACGRARSNPEEQLGSQTLSEVLYILRRKFACVLIDSPAAMTYGDAELLAQLSDATILIIRGHKTPMAAAYRVAGQLQAVRANVLGVVLTNVHTRQTDTLGYR